MTSDGFWTSWRRHRLRAVICTVGGLVALTGLAGQAQRPGPGEGAQVVWPPPPEPPRICLRGAYASSVDVGATARPARVSLVEALLGRRAAGADARPVRELHKPFGVAVDRYGRIIVTDPAIPGVVVLDPDRHGFQLIDRAGGQAALRSPIGVATDAAGNIYVGDNALRQIMVFGPDFAYRGEIGRGTVMAPSGLAVDETRKRLIVADTRQHQLLVFDLASRALVTRVGRRGTGAGEFNFPTGVAVGPDGAVYVTDTMNCRVNVFGADLRPVRSFGSLGIKPGQFRRPKGIAVDAANIVYVTDADFNNFQLFTAEGQPLMWVGEFGTRPGQMILPAGIAVDRGRRLIVVAEQVTRRVQLFERVQ